MRIVPLMHTSGMVFTVKVHKCMRRSPGAFGTVRNELTIILSAVVGAC